MIISRKNIFVFIALISTSVFAQTDWVKWEKSEPSYHQKDDYEVRDYNLKIETVADLILKPVINAYWFFISDVDGANCPFHPSCSSFLVQSIKETNPIQGTLMFFDRFTRDTNVFGRFSHYPRYGKNQFYDPVTLYQLENDKIKFIPANTFVNDEN